MIPEVDGELKNWGSWAEHRPFIELGYAQLNYSSGIGARASGEAGESEAALHVDTLLAEFRRRWPEHEKAVRAKYLYQMTDPRGADYCGVSMQQYKNYIDRAHFWFGAHLLRSSAA